MAKKKKKQEKVKEDLDAAFFELDHLERYLDDSEGAQMEIDRPLALFLIRAAREKIEYFSRKYNFKVSLDDLFYLEEYGDFIRKAEGVLTKEERMEKADAEMRAEA